MSYTLKVGCDYKGTVIDVKSDEDMAVDAELLPDEDEVHVPGPGDCVMELPPTVAEYVIDDDDEVLLEFINE